MGIVGCFGAISYKIDWAMSHWAGLAFLLNLLDPCLASGRSLSGSSEVAEGNFGRLDESFIFTFMVVLAAKADTFYTTAM